MSDVIAKTPYHRLIRVDEDRYRIQRRLKRNLWDVIRRRPKWFTLIGFIDKSHGIVLIGWYDYKINRPGDIFTHE